jgi:hypothetical protein
VSLDPVWEGEGNGETRGEETAAEETAGEGEPAGEASERERPTDSDARPPRDDDRRRRRRGPRR